MRGLEQLRQLIDPTPERDVDDMLLDVAKTFAPATAKRVVSERECSIATEVVAKVAVDDETRVLDRLFGAGAQLEGKRIVAHLGKVQVSYLSHRNEWVSKEERGVLRVSAPDAEDVLDRLRISSESLEMQGDSDPERS